MRQHNYSNCSLSRQLCQCGRDKEWHENLDFFSEVKWDPDKHTDWEKCSTFGSIQFSGFGKESGRDHALVNIRYYFANK